MRGRAKRGLPSWGPVSRGGLRPVNDDSAKIVHVGPRGSGFHQVAELAEKPGRIVVGEKMGRIEASASGPAGVSVASIRAPAGSSEAPPPPSVPSGRRWPAPRSPARRASAMASASAYSWFGPPRPFPRMGRSIRRRRPRGAPSGGLQRTGSRRARRRHPGPRPRAAPRRTHRAGRAHRPPRARKASGPGLIMKSRRSKMGSPGLGDLVAGMASALRGAGSSP